jgi:hypothetical protein
MFDEPTQLRFKAEACRRLADMSNDDTERKALWLHRADDWEQLASKAEKELRRRRSKSLLARRIERYCPPTNNQV